MQEVTTRPDSMSYLSGSTIPPWHAVGLRNLWSAEQIAQFLKTGVNDHAAAFGAMTEVVHASTQYFAEADLSAVAQFLTSLSTRKAAPTVASSPGSVPETLYTTRGGLAYDQFCSSCHQRDGRGAPGVVPPLAGNASVLSEDPTSVIHVVLTGWTEAATQHSKHAFSMPDYGRLTDAELAEILTFVRTSWGNAGAAITASQIKDQRDALYLAPTAPSKFTVSRFADMLAAPNADQLVLGMRLMTETKALLPDNVGDVMNCSSCHLNGGTVAKGSPFNGVAALFPMDQPRAGRIISIEERLNDCFLRSMNGKPSPGRFEGHEGHGRLHVPDEGRRDAPTRKIARTRDGASGPQAHPRSGPRQDAVRGELRRLSRLGRSRHEVGRRRLAVPSALGRQFVQRRRRDRTDIHRSLLHQGEHADRPFDEIPAGTGRATRTRTPSTSRTISHINHDLISPIRSTIGRRVASQRTRDTESCGRLARADSRTRCRKRRRIARW